MNFLPKDWHNMSRDEQIRMCLDILRQSQNFYLKGKIKEEYLMDDIDNVCEVLSFLVMEPEQKAEIVSGHRDEITSYIMDYFDGYSAVTDAAKRRLINWLKDYGCRTMDDVRKLWDHMTMNKHNVLIDGKKVRGIGEASYKALSMVMVAVAMEGDNGN